MRLFIVRHGESTNNRLDASLDYEEYLQKRSPDPPLTELGERQAEAVADHLANATVAEHFFWNEYEMAEPGYNIKHIFCSPMLRSLQTALPISRALGLQPEVMIDIHEHGGMFYGDPGDVQSIVNHTGLTRSEIQEQFAGYVLPEVITEDGWWHSGYEDLPGCYARAARTALALRRLAQEQVEDEPEMRAVLVSHASYMDCLIKAFLDLLPSSDHFFVHYNTAITRIDIHRDGRQYLRYINRTEHFTPNLLAAQTDASI